MPNLAASICAPPPRRRASRAPGIALAAALLLPAYAGAATLVVDLDGTYDAATDGCTGADPAFTAIDDANTAAADGDTIVVCPGVYPETQLLISKALTFQGSGAETTIIDGGGGTGLALAGTVRIRTNTGDVTVDGFTIRNPKAVGASETGLRIGVDVKSDAPITVTITNNVIQGTNEPTWGQDFGFYSNGPTALESIVFQHNVVKETGSNPILIEQHTGPTDVSFNTFDRGVSQNGVSAYFNMSHSGTQITSLQRVSSNTIDLGNDPGPYTAGNASSGIVFFGGFGGSAGGFTNVEITGNTIANVEAFRRGIALTNGNAAPGTDGAIANAVVSCNAVSGPGDEGSVGIRLLGLVADPSITGNSISGVETGLLARDNDTHVASGIVLNDNSFTAIGLRAIDWWSDVPFDAERNWYDSVSGPTEPGNPNGAGAAIGASGGPPGAGVVDDVPWLGSDADADPGTCFVPGDSGVCSGVSTCDLDGCTAPSKPDADADGQCDAIDVCHNDGGGQTFVTKPKSKVLLNKINAETVPGNDLLTVSAFFALADGRAFSEIAPDVEGVRLLLYAGDGTSVRLDAMVAPDLYDKIARKGWKRSGNGKTWTFVDRSLAPSSGITRVLIGDKSSTKTPRLVKVSVTGKKSSYPVAESEAPIEAVVVLGDATAGAEGLCGESAYSAADCAWNRPKTKLTCRR